MSKIIDSEVVTVTQGSAPSVTTDKIYNVGGSLYFNGTEIGGSTALSDITITTTGTVSDGLRYDVIPSISCALQIPGERIFVDGAGKCISFNTASPAVGSGDVTFSDLVGIKSTLLQSLTLSGVTGITFSALKIISTYSDDIFTLSGGSSITTYSFPSLMAVNGGFKTNSGSSTPAGLTSISFPELLFVTGTLNLNSMSSVTISTQVKVKYIGALTLSAMQGLLTYELPAIVSIGTITASTNVASLTTFTLGSTLKTITGNVVLSSCALSETSVNALLASLVALDGTNGTTLYGSGRTITITGTSAVPTGQGLTDKATLTARGATVTTNT